MENAAMCEKILHTIEEIMMDDTLLTDFSIVTVENNIENHSPVLYESPHLGLESWCVRYVYDYACSKLLQARKTIAEKKIKLHVKEDFYYLLVGALLICPDVPTFWNMKRELSEDNIVNFKEGLAFSRLVLSHKPKSNEAFSYRRWLINRKLSQQVRSPQAIIKPELKICEQTAENTPNNYHSWIHRQWVIGKFLEYVTNHKESSKLIEAELEKNEAWISKHISENCGYQYRQFLINKLKFHENLPFPYKELYYQPYMKGQFRIPQSLYRKDPEKFLLRYSLTKPAKNNSIKNLDKFRNYLNCLFKEYSYMYNISDENLEYERHEPYWLHRRYIVHELLEASHKYLGKEFNPGHNLNKIQINETESLMKKIYHKIDCEPSSIYKLTKFHWTNMFLLIVQVESEYINTNIKKGAVRRDYAKKHERWLKYVMDFDVKFYE